MHDMIPAGDRWAPDADKGLSASDKRLSRAMPDSDLAAAISAHAASRHAHHEAGHAVAVVHRGGELCDVYLGTTDWSALDDSADTPGATVHRSDWQDQPFITFAGPCFEAMWTVDHDPDDVDDFEEALACAWDENYDGDTAKYESRVETLDNVAKDFGFFPVGRAWESEWIDELEPLWPAVREVAGWLIDGQPATHDKVLCAIERARAEPH